MRFSGSALAGLALSLLPLAQASAEPPAEPRVIEVAGGPGKPGGEMVTLVSREKDTRLLTVYGYARLVGYSPDLTIQPDILRAVDVEDGRIFTFHIRQGHKWSDGSPFTAEDFRYWWEDVANNAELSPFGVPSALLVDGKEPEFEVVDEHTVRYAWPGPNPFFLPLLAAAAPLDIYRPAAYLKQFHKSYLSAEDLDAKVKTDQARDWVQLHFRRDRMYEADNPEMPTLQPWHTVTAPPNTRFVAERNAYFHRVDQNGQQLPYIDKVALDIVDSKLIPIKTGAGETTLQARGLAFSDYTFLLDSAERSGMETSLWRTARGAHLALYPNLNVKDAGWKALLRDARFRRALSMGVYRDEINQAMYYGLGIGGNNTVLPESPLYEPELRDAWAQFDPKAANDLLDEMGLTERNSDDIRLMPDGRPIEIVVETAGEDAEQTDLLQLIHDSWRQLGIKLFSRPMQREVLQNRIFSGETVMSIFYGVENGVPTADMPPTEFAPVEQIKFQWPAWGQFYETKGAAGEKPDMPSAERLMILFEQWSVSRTREERERIWHEMLQIHADQVFTIGLIAGVFQPVSHKATLKGVPEEAIFNWDPGAQFGMYLPDTFWFEK
ncbi:ABC transporter substrate-binding protein [Marinivivus vitaminiproducens]|uniref:ABC transporter substrate-binding protein n=1 Tax=Marinivivus vitaminiproducens TaxID=3035935 RepID=UPI002799E16F|nr:ABC transporter substrate-binding protein [Geminicoccaceae bacterium SCSIO 64248]